MQLYRTFCLNKMIVLILIVRRCSNQVNRFFARLSKKTLVKQQQLLFASNWRTLMHCLQF